MKREQTSGVLGGWPHVFVAPTDRPELLVLLLHGTGGDEHDLLGLGRRVAPGAALLSPRGGVREMGAHRFFRRLAPGVFDVEDLKRRAEELAQFVELARGHYGVSSGSVVAVGYSNGANIASGLMLTRPAVLTGAALLRPMVPLEPATPLDLHGAPVLCLWGHDDPTMPADEPRKLQTLLGRAGARVSVEVTGPGHALNARDLSAMAEWFDSVFPRDAIRPPVSASPATMSDQ